MSRRKQILGRLGKIGSEALISAVNLKQEIETQGLDRLERLAKRLKLVRREEFESMQSSLKQARAIQERLEARIAALESQATNRGGAKTIHRRAKKGN